MYVYRATRHAFVYISTERTRVRARVCLTMFSCDAKEAAVSGSRTAHQRQRASVSLSAANEMHETLSTG